MKDTAAEPQEMGTMPKFVIERTVPGAGRMDEGQLQELAAGSNGVLRQLGEGIQWVHSYVAEDRHFCVYNARDKGMIREHARIGGFPCDNIRQVSAIIDPVTGEAP
ncbi:DUF4242 domain-containing protein [Paeniglutamicibacter psychrophenolicus]|uniref:DUF4242 domain-containing protein n=1 Tax=Paeniglutamicibacter psychrophenolicus TaxID=257454 RepID=A0ABS4WJF1_9MICC|nr:hypothetical protein [Paeniglutamicibacter psychrophenolicus]